jgi:hypothetical protein
LGCAFFDKAAANEEGASTLAVSATDGFDSLTAVGVVLVGFGFCDSKFCELLFAA